MLRNNSTISPARIILSFDVEEHHRIESAAGLSLEPERKAEYADRVEPSTRWVLEQLGPRGIRATFFVLGQIARAHPALVRAIDRDGHELASHGWDHQRLHQLTPATFRTDLRQSKDALEQVTGKPIVGYRAPTFSLVAQTAWAVDVLAEEGFGYDSSIYPVRHDRYGVPRAPRAPFWVRGEEREILEIPPATLRVLRTKVPIGGGGYFRLLPVALLERALYQVGRDCRPAVAMLYFHPWEFDPLQPRLPLRGLNRFRTYVGLSSNRQRFTSFLATHEFVRALDVLHDLVPMGPTLDRFALVPAAAATATVKTG
jgi:polysaccharide deacetylase family protein (PEP-CTERM system associated)